MAISDGFSPEKAGLNPSVFLTDALKTRFIFCKRRNAGGGFRTGGKAGVSVFLYAQRAQAALEKGFLESSCHGQRQCARRLRPAECLRSDARNVEGDQRCRQSLRCAAHHRLCESRMSADVVSGGDVDQFIFLIRHLGKLGHTRIGCLDFPDGYGSVSVFFRIPACIDKKNYYIMLLL